MLKLFRKLHHIPSILLGLPLFILCLTGTILLFEEDVARWQNPSLYHVEVQGEPLPMPQLIAKVRAELGEEYTLTSITTDDATTPYVAGVKGSRSRYAVDPYSGEVLGERTMHPFFRTTMMLHRFWLDTPKAKGEMTLGKLAVGISTLSFIVILLSGLVLWIPKTTKALRHRLRITTTKGWKRFWYDTHVVGGFYTTLLLLAIALTGLYWSFEWYRTGVVELLSSPEREQMVAEAKRTAIQMIDGVQVIDATVKTPQSIHAIIKSIHMGTWGGAISKWLYAIAMIIATTLPLTGYWLWWKKKSRNLLR